jgi:RHS repeat-associated protein
VITPIAHQQFPVEVPLEQLALMTTNDPKISRYDGEPPVFVPEPVKIATIGSLVGILSQTVVAQTVQPRVYYYLTDHLGTPQKVMDGAGAVVWSGDYKPFGEVTSGVSTIQNQFRFPGQYYEKETELHYNYHRYYQPKAGRYATTDPIGLTTQNNLYTYSGSNPVVRKDPGGLWWGSGHSEIMIYAVGLLPGYFSDLDLEILIAANVGVDIVNPFDNAAHYMPGTCEKAEALIENMLEIAVDLELTGFHRQAMYFLGAGSHTVGDKPAHSDQDAGWSEHFKNPSPDDPKFHADEFARAKKATVEYLQRFIDAVNRGKRTRR